MMEQGRIWFGEGVKWADRIISGCGPELWGEGGGREGEAGGVGRVWQDSDVCEPE
jgi:hypothetical protein